MLKMTDDGMNIERVPCRRPQCGMIYNSYEN